MTELCIQFNYLKGITPHSQVAEEGSYKGPTGWPLTIPRPQVAQTQPNNLSLQSPGNQTSPRLWSRDAPVGGWNFTKAVTLTELKLLPSCEEGWSRLHLTPTQGFKLPPRWSSSGWTMLDTSLLPPPKVCTANPFRATFPSQHCLQNTGFEEQGPPITSELEFLCSAGIRYGQGAHDESSPNNQRPKQTWLASHPSLQHNSNSSGSKISILWEQFLCELNASLSSCLQVPPEASIIHTSLENTH